MFAKEATQQRRTEGYQLRLGVQTIPEPVSEPEDVFDQVNLLARLTIHEVCRLVVALLHHVDGANDDAAYSQSAGVVVETEDGLRVTTSVRLVPRVKEVEEYLVLAEMIIQYRSPRWNGGFPSV
jgi:hypothetical protein